jgi:hypothetical protein
MKEEKNRIPAHRADEMTCIAPLMRGKQSMEIGCLAVARKFFYYSCRQGWGVSSLADPVFPGLNASFREVDFLSLLHQAGWVVSSRTQLPWFVCRLERTRFSPLQIERLSYEMSYWVLSEAILLPDT